MPVRLVKIRLDNWEEALDLPTSEDHKRFVASNLYSIAQAQFFPDLKACAIYHDETMVGFAMFGTTRGSDIDDEDRRFWVWRLMIAEGHRRKGYGREAARLVIEEARSRGFPCVVLSTGPENHKAIKLYEGFGFKATGKIKDGEEEYVLTF